jgi:hypothetical protein
LAGGAGATATGGIRLPSARWRNPLILPTDEVSRMGRADAGGVFGVAAHAPPLDSSIV